MPASSTLNGFEKKIIDTHNAMEKSPNEAENHRNNSGLIGSLVQNGVSNDIPSSSVAKMTKDTSEVIDPAKSDPLVSVKVSSPPPSNENASAPATVNQSNNNNNNNEDPLCRLMSTLERCRRRCETKSDLNASNSTSKATDTPSERTIKKKNSVKTLPERTEQIEKQQQPSAKPSAVSVNAEATLGSSQSEPLVVPKSVVEQPNLAESNPKVEIVAYEDERQLPDIMRLITKDLSEPYSIYTYRFFIHNWPSLCYLARDTSTGEYVGAIVCKQDDSVDHMFSNNTADDRQRRTGYIAMLAVDQRYRRMKLGSRLACTVLDAMQRSGCDEVVLETEITNSAALRLYENLGFVRAKRLFRYYLNGVDAYRLKLWFTPPSRDQQTQPHWENVEMS